MSNLIDDGKPIITPEDACEAYARIQESGREIKRMKAELAKARRALREDVRKRGYDKVLKEFVADERREHPEWSAVETYDYCEETLRRWLEPRPQHSSR